ncbi:NAD(P)-dependent oxidoreductase [Acuticoccus sp. MNP-M23]|uniref:NAD-dependent epimerase/dehydratase family protein n=1 Tax=Acuticoccus sp. MNP-M23 TaxID=3072793 RepID=UPI002815AF41|nr:NAD(P)-dependent oxidoreductase [Acuticoccus sp. MNP-M23]WMS44323.1 NAD(P)-dependent oxidoreductase [Acuticoccus sp. MNP-M23]
MTLPGETAGAPVVLVTGAAGFLGRRVVAALAGHGATVRAGVNRSALPADLAGRAGVESVSCQMGDAASLQAAAAGADAIVHGAYGGDPSAMADEAGRLLAAADAGGVRRMVMLSTIDVYGDRTGDIVEGDPPEPPLRPYGAAKRAVEDALLAWVQRTRQAPGEAAAAVALRIGCVLGPGSALWFDGLAARMAAGGIGPMGAAGEGLAPVVHVDDVAQLAALAALRPVTGFHALNAVAPPEMTWNAYFAALAARAGVVARALDARAVQRRAPVGRAAKGWRKLGLPGLGALAASPRPGELALFGRRARYSTDAAAEIFGWVPQRTVADALDEAFGDR